MFAAIHATAGDAEKLLRLAQEFSPQAEQTSVDTVVLDADGLERIHGLPQQIAAAIARRAAERGLQASVAIASNLDTAVHAARGFGGVSVIPHGDEAKYLGSLPLTVLGPTPEMLETLERWGIRRLRDLAALPELGLAERLGVEGLHLHKLARGAGDRPLVPVAEPLHFAEEAELEYPLELLEPLMFVLAQLLHALRARLSSHGLATNALRLRLQLENRGEHARTLRFPVPMLDTKAFLKLLDLDLECASPCGAGGEGKAGSRAGQATRGANRVVRAHRAGAGKIGTDVGAAARVGGRGECGVAGIAGYASAGSVSDAALRRSQEAGGRGRDHAAARDPAGARGSRADGFRTAGACAGGGGARACDRGCRALAYVGRLVDRGSVGAR